MTYVNLCSAYKRISPRVLVLNLPLECQFIHSLIHTFRSDLLGACYAPDREMQAEDAAVNKADFLKRISCHELTSYELPKKKKKLVTIPVTCSWLDENYNF